MSFIQLIETYFRLEEPPQDFFQLCINTEQKLTNSHLVIHIKWLIRDSQACVKLRDETSNSVQLATDTFLK